MGLISVTTGIIWDHCSDEKPKFSLIMLRKRMKAKNEPQDKWVADCPKCAKNDHAWVRCNTGKKSNPGYFALGDGGGDYKLYEECIDCGAYRLIVVRGGRAEYAYRQDTSRRDKERRDKERRGKERR